MPAGGPAGRIGWPVADFSRSGTLSTSRCAARWRLYRAGRVPGPICGHIGAYLRMCGARVRRLCPTMGTKARLKMADSCGFKQVFETSV